MDRWLSHWTCKQPNQGCSRRLPRGWILPSFSPQSIHVSFSSRWQGCTSGKMKPRCHLATSSLLFAEWCRMYNSCHSQRLQPVTLLVRSERPIWACQCAQSCCEAATKWRRIRGISHWRSDYPSISPSRRVCIACFAWTSAGHGGSYDKRKNGNIFAGEMPSWHLQFTRSLAFQSLVIPFAFLIYNQRDTVLSLLESTEIQGRSSLDILIQTWCENAETFQGFWPTRISSLALSQLYAAERPSLQNLMVKGDIIVKPETQNGNVSQLRPEYWYLMSPLLVIMTRSRTKTGMMTWLGVTSFHSDERTL